MKKKPFVNCLLINSVILIASGCDLTSVPLKSEYNKDAVEITTTRSVDSVWSTLTNIFTTSGVLIKKIDNEKGTILTKRMTINSVYSFEKTDGQLEHPEAWVVLEKVYNKDKEWKPKEIDAKWNIKVAEAGGIKTIKIDPMVLCSYFPNSFTRMELVGRSTGKLEKLLEQSLK